VKRFGFLKTGKERMFKLNKLKLSLTVFLLCFMLLLPAGPLLAQDQKFTAQVSQTQVGTGEAFEISFSIKGNAERFSPPEFEGFQVVSGPNVSQSMTSINGSMSVSSSYSFVLVPVKAGTYSIGAASVVIGGRRYTTGAIEIRVVKGRPVPQGGSGNNGGRTPEAEDLGNEPLPADISKSLFLRSQISKSTAYQGEQVVLTYKLYTRAGIVDSRVDKLPDLNGFWNEDVKPQQQTQWRVETYKGLKYHVADVKKTILFAEHSGKIVINPFEMTFIVRLPSASAGDIMDQFFGSYKDVKYSAKSLPIELNVKPLPEAGKPAGFNGAVGKFSVAANLDKKELKANEALNYKVKIAGSGNLKLLQPLTINFPPDFEKYDPKTNDFITAGASSVTGSREYAYLLIPRHQGSFDIEPLHFSYFNPESGKYVELTTDGFKVKVNKGLLEENVTALSQADKKEVKILDKDIRYIKTDNLQLEEDGDQFFGSAGHIFLLLLAPVLCIAAFILRDKYRKDNLDQAKVKSRKAAKVVARHLAAAQKHLQQQQRTEFYAAIFRGLYGYLSDKLGIAMADLQREHISTILTERDVTEGTVALLLETLDLCEMARFAPVQVAEEEVFEKAKFIINQIENEIV
jgi:hypothetical protein